MNTTPEARARKVIDGQLQAAGWVVQDRTAMNRTASLGVALREFPLATGPCDYLLIVAGRACGVIEAKPAGTTLSGVTEQARGYQPKPQQALARWSDPLRFDYQASGTEILFSDRADPLHRSRRVFGFHRPETLHEWINRRYLAYILSGYLELINANTPSVTVKHLSSRTLASIPLPLPPIDRQTAIAARIDELFAEIDDGEAALARARDDLATWRKALLKAAVTGELTADWRAANPAAETGVDLLADLLVNKQVGGRWKMAAQSDLIPKPDNLPALPSGWTWSTVGQIAYVTGGITKNVKRDALPLRMPYLRVGNVYAGRVDLTRMETIGVSEGEAERSAVQDGDLLIVEGNGSIDQIGRSAIWEGQINPCLHQNHLIKVRVSKRRIAEWIQVWLQSPWGRKELEAQASSTSGLHTLSISKVAGLRCPVPPLEELDMSLSLVQRLTAETTAGGDDMNAMRATAATLRQAILAAAFRGELA